MPVPAVRHAACPEADFQPKEEAARTHVHVAEDAHAAAPSPARALQARLERDLLQHTQAQTADARWPLYVALPFWGGVSAAMWAAIIGCAWMVLRHI